MSDETIKKFVVTALALSAFAVWMLFGHASPSCAGRCVTAFRRGTADARSFAETFTNINSRGRDEAGRSALDGPLFVWLRAKKRFSSAAY